VKGNRYADYEAAGRVLKAIEEHHLPSQADVLAVRLWAIPRNGLRSLEDIANEIVKDGKWRIWI
jgi:hypothetical protein